MAGMKLEGFQGLIPRLSDRLLSPMAATEARNTKLLSGELRGFRALTQEADLVGCTSELRRAFRVPSTAPQADPCDVFIANLNGPDTATAYTELARGVAGTFYGNAQLDTSQAATGSASSATYEQLSMQAKILQSKHLYGSDLCPQLVGGTRSLQEAILTFVHGRWRSTTMGGRTSYRPLLGLIRSPPCMCFLQHQT